MPPIICPRCENKIGVVGGGDKCPMCGRVLAEREIITGGDALFVHGRLRAQLATAEKVIQAARDLSKGVEKEFNEKGAGGYALARLYDLRAALAEYDKERT